MVMREPSPDAEPYLKGGLSVTGKVWKQRPYQEFDALTLSQKKNIPLPVSRILCARGVTLDTYDSFINPTLKDSMIDPNHFKDMDKAVARVKLAFEKGEKIAVFGDYDVDGATSAATLKRYFSSIGQDITIYIPDRIEEGYGPNPLAFDRLKEMGIQVVLTVDCGITAYQSLSYAKEIGLDIIVLDHHVGEPTLPDAHAVINPNRLDESSPYTYLAAVGVVFLFLVALNRVLRDVQYFSTHQEPDLFSLLDLVALGTVCDVMPLRGLNRAFVAQGLKVIHKRQNIGLNALLDVAQINQQPDVYHLGYVLGPRVNAGGRVGESSLGAHLLSCTEQGLADRYAQKLDHHNLERRALEDTIFESALNQVLEHHKDARILLIHGPWHPGIVGIVASRLKETFHKPTCVLCEDGDLFKASGRSIEGIDLGNMVIEARQLGLLRTGGGHALAAGFTLSKDKLEDLRIFFESKLPVVMPDPTQMYDCIISTQAITDNLIEGLHLAGPYGQGNPEPKFVIHDVTLHSVHPLTSNGYRLVFKGQTGDMVQCFSFRSKGSALEDVLLKGKGQKFHVYGKIQKSIKYNNLQVILEDLAYA